MAFLIIWMYFYSPFYSKYWSKTKSIGLFFLLSTDSDLPLQETISESNIDDF